MGGGGTDIQYEKFVVGDGLGAGFRVEFEFQV